MIVAARPFTIRVADVVLSADDVDTDVGDADPEPDDDG